MDDRRCFRSGVAAVDRPGAHFLLAGGEIRLESQQVITGANEPVEAGRLETKRRQKLAAVLRRQLRELRFNPGGEGNYLGVLAARCNGRSKRREVRTFVAGQLGIADVSGV